jgi:hypothetical protein
MAKQPSRPSESPAAIRSRARRAKAKDAAPTIAAEPNLGGRATLYSDALADSLIAWISGGKSQRKWCDLEGHPHVITIQRWKNARPGFAASLTQAREEWTHSIIDEAMDIADDGVNDTYEDEDGNNRVNTDIVARSKLRVDTRMRLAAMVNPARYGAKLDVMSDGKALAGRSDEQLDERLIALFAQGSIPVPALPAPVAVDGGL